jgi:hypothetical protein
MTNCTVFCEEVGWLSRCRDWATGWTIRGSNPDTSKNFSPKVRTGCGAYPIRRGSGLFPEDKAAGA